MKPRVPHIKHVLLATVAVERRYTKVWGNIRTIEFRWKVNYPANLFTRNLWKLSYRQASEIRPPSFAIFYICHDFDGNGSAQCIFASMFCNSDVRLRHQISGTKGLNQWVKRPVVLSRSVTLIAWTSCVCRPTVIVGLQMSLSSHCPNAGSMHLAFKGLCSGWLANRTLQSHVHKMSIGLMLDHCLWHCTAQQRRNHSFYITPLGGSTMTR